MVVSFAASLLQTCSMVYLILLVAFGWGNQTIIYWLAINSQSGELIAIGLLAFLSIGIAYVVLTLISRLFGERKHHDRLGAKAVVLSFFATPFLCGAYFVILWQVGGPLPIYLQHLESAYAANHNYHLMFYSHDPAEGYNDFYYLYECDSLNLLCRKTQTIARTRGGITPDVTEITLAPDAEAKTISLRVNGEIVYIHHP